MTNTILSVWLLLSSDSEDGGGVFRGNLQVIKGGEGSGDLRDLTKSARLILIHICFLRLQEVSGSKHIGNKASLID